MKRGFLNSPRYKRAMTADSDARPPKRNQENREVEGVAGQDVLAADVCNLSDVSMANDVDVNMDTSTDGDPVEPSTNPADLKEKAKQKAVEDFELFNKDDFVGTDLYDSSKIRGRYITRVPPRRPGWGRDPEEDILHTVPSLYGGPERKRSIFCRWPRALDGKNISADNPKGKRSPDGYSWGATLYDWFAVRRIVSCQYLESYMSGSSLLAEMKEMGELNAAAEEIKWAESEGEPRDEGVADTEELVIGKEGQIRLTGSHDFSTINFCGPDEGDKEDEDSDGEYEREPVGPCSIPPPPEIPVTSPFHPSRYPKPWPLVPFENDDFSLLLQDRIPTYLLPRTLYVHDPFNLLAARKIKYRDTQWDSRPDIVRTYNLALSESVLKESAEERKKAEEMEELKARMLVVLRYKRTEDQVKNHEAIVEVPLPPYPRRLTSIEDAHLYISPVAKVGEGHHSVVYRGEWELPRDLYVRPSVCARCFKESVDGEIQKLKDTGRLEKMLRAASWGTKGYTGCKPTKAELDAVNDPINPRRDGEIIEREIICIAPADTPPSEVLGLLDNSPIWNVCRSENKVATYYLQIGEDVSTDDSDVPIIRIDPPFSYESQKNCPHRHPLFGAGPVPPTTKFTVTAKLSLEHDPHLSTEASNYQQFPDYFFRHYDGYVLIAQLRAIVPIHAIVPQFYGYYEPCTTMEERREKGDQPYLSPILLLEHCGQPIDPATLSREDQEECAGMLLRFQRAGWLHGSVYPRNFLVQRGRPTEFPPTRRARPELSFRLIDFGRSRMWTGAEEKRAEEMQALDLFKELFLQMSVTLSIDPKN